MREERTCSQISTLEVMAHGIGGQVEFFSRTPAFASACFRGHWYMACDSIEALAGEELGRFVDS